MGKDLCGAELFYAIIHLVSYILPYFIYPMLVTFYVFYSCIIIFIRSMECTDSVTLYTSISYAVVIWSHMLGSVHWGSHPLQWNQSSNTASASPQWRQTQQANESCLLR